MKRISFIAVLWLFAGLLCGCLSAKDGYGWTFCSRGESTETAYTAAAKKTLDGLVDAYQNKDPLSFMRWVSDDYPSAPQLLDTRIRNSFSRYFYIELTYTLTSVVPNDDGSQLSVDVQFRRKLGDKTTGQINSTYESTNVILVKSGGEYKLLQMHRPILFR